jgi:glycosyltransferase involved in cell wall biosynthesis
MHDLMKATRQLKGRAGRVFSVVLAGPFDSEEEGLRIRQLVTDYGLEDTVIFLGPVSGIKKEQAFLHADVFVLPSYSEGIPQSMLEAMAYGLPVVVSGVGGIPEVVREGVEGIIVKPGDIEGLCQALRQVMESVECRARMGNAGRRRVAEQYTVSTYMERLHTLYRSVLPPGAMSCSP